jgi:hypothetical protein
VPDIPPFLCPSYEDTTVALSTGVMLRECIKHEALARIVMHSEVGAGVIGFPPSFPTCAAERQGCFMRRSSFTSSSSTCR